MGRCRDGRMFYWGRDELQPKLQLMRKVRASSTMPLLMPITEIDGDDFVDGALGPTGGIALDAAQQDSFDKFLVVFTRRAATGSRRCGSRWRSRHCSAATRRSPGRSSPAPRTTTGPSTSSWSWTWSRASSCSLRTPRGISPGAASADASSLQARTPRTRSASSWGWRSEPARWPPDVVGRSPCCRSAVTVRRASHGLPRCCHIDHWLLAYLTR